VCYPRLATLTNRKNTSKLFRFWLYVHRGLCRLCNSVPCLAGCRAFRKPLHLF
jgi:hypothetical protein